jgi:hypothetical protein
MWATLLTVQRRCNTGSEMMPTAARHLHAGEPLLPMCCWWWLFRHQFRFQFQFQFRTSSCSSCGIIQRPMHCWRAMWGLLYGQQDEP